MTIISTTIAALPTTLQVVNRVLMECGVEQVSTLNPGNDRSNVVLEALNDGMYDIYGKAVWPWTRSRYSIPYNAGQYEYQIPADFRKIAIAPYNFSVTQPTSQSIMTEYSIEEFYESFPAATISNSYGSPYAYTVDAGYIRFYPAPDANSVALYPQAVFEYFKWPQRRQAVTDDASNFDVPVQLIPALVSYGKAELKRYLEYPDWINESQKYQTQIDQQLAAMKQTRQPYAMRPRYNPQWRF